MYEKDYIMRMIRELIRVLLEIFGLREKGSLEEAYEVIDLTLQQFTGLSSKVLDTFDAESLINFFSPGGNLNHERCFVTGVLLKEEADLLFNQNFPEEALKRYRKAYALLLKVKDSAFAEMLPGMDKIFSELESKIEPRKGNFPI